MAEKTGIRGNYLLREAEKLRHFLQEMEENNEDVRPFSGSLGYPGFIRAIYGGKVRMGFVDENKKTD